MYAIIVLPNGGPDLEAYTFPGSGSSSAANKTGHGWRQACSLFWQVTKALGHAEQLVSFEVSFISGSALRYVWALTLTFQLQLQLQLY